MPCKPMGKKTSAGFVTWNSSATPGLPMVQVVEIKVLQLCFLWILEGDLTARWLSWSLFCGMVMDSFEWFVNPFQVQSGTSFDIGDLGFVCVTLVFFSEGKDSIRFWAEIQVDLPILYHKFHGIAASESWKVNCLDFCAVAQWPRKFTFSWSQWLVDQIGWVVLGFLSVSWFSTYKNGVVPRCQVFWEKNYQRLPKLQIYPAFGGQASWASRCLTLIRIPLKQTPKFPWIAWETGWNFI